MWRLRLLRMLGKDPTEKAWAVAQEAAEVTVDVQEKLSKMSGGEWIGPEEIARDGIWNLLEADSKQK